MSTSPRIAFRAVRTLSGNPIPREEFLEAAAQTFKQGAPCLVNTSGYLAEVGTNPTYIMGIATRDGQNGTNAGDKKQVIELAHPDTLFVGNMDASAAGTGVTAQANIGAAYGITKHGGSGKWTVDTDKKQTGTTLTGVVRVWNFWNQDTEVVGDILGRVLFQFDASVFQGGTGPRVRAGSATTAAAQDTIVTGLNKLIAVVAQWDTDAALANFIVTADIGDQAGAPAAGSFYLNSWKATSSGDCTPIAATTLGKVVSWIAVGY